MIEKKVEQVVRQLQEHHDVPTVVEYVPPSNSLGKDGDKKLIKLENKYYLYQKIEKQWFKVELERA